MRRWAWMLGGLIVWTVHFMGLYAIASAADVVSRADDPLWRMGGLAFSGFGLLVASRPRTIEGISGVLNFVMLPMWILSGIFFSASNFPDAVQPFIQALPLTALIDALRAVVLEGATLAGVAGELTLLSAWGVVPFFVAIRVFRWK